MFREEAFTAMDTYREVFNIVGSQTSCHQLFEETCFDDEALARYQRIDGRG